MYVSVPLIFLPYLPSALIFPCLIRRVLPLHLVLAQYYCVDLGLQSNLSNGGLSAVNFHQWQSLDWDNVAAQTGCSGTFFENALHPAYKWNRKMLNIETVVHEQTMYEAC